MKELVTKEQVASTLRDLFKDKKPESEAAWNYRKAAAVLEYFSFNEIRPVEGPQVEAPPEEPDSDLALEYLYSISTVVYDENRQPWRSLTDEARHETLARLYSEDGREGFRSALAANPDRPNTELQHLFEDYLTGDYPEIGEQSRIQMLCISRILNWLDGIIEDLPNPSEVSRLIESESVLAPFKHLLNISKENPQGTFFGRENELRKLYDYVEVMEPGSRSAKLVRGARKIFNIREKTPLGIFAPGGTGKSTLIAKFVMDHARFRSSGDLSPDSPDSDDRFPFIYLDFDKASLDPEEPITLLMDAVLQLAVQYPESRELFQKMHSDWVNRIREQNIERLSDLKEEFSFEVENIEEFITEFSEVINNEINISKAPLLLLIDTFEEVQWRSQGLVEKTLGFLEKLQAKVPRLRTIISGRSEVTWSAYEIENYPLPSFDQDAARQYLEKNGISPSEVAKRVAQQVGGSPLTLRLAAELYKLEGAGIESVDDPKMVEFLDLLQGEHIHAQLYKRILGHIRNEDVKKLAHPGLVLRRITPDLILEVLAGPCEITIPDMDAARQLFDKLKKEIALVSSKDADVLVHRPDIRCLMLNLLKADQPEKVQEIHENAIKYYSERNDDDSRLEEIYHRLSLDFDRETLDERWQEQLHYSQDDVEELPLRSQGYVAAHLQIEVSPEVWDKADFQDWEEYAIRSAGHLVKANLPMDALALLQKRKGERYSERISAIEREIEKSQEQIKEIKPSRPSLKAAKATRKPMSEWYSPDRLFETGRKIIAATIFHQNQRPATNPEPGFHDYSGGPDSLQARPGQGIWIDYVADLGDGWNSTYSVAYNMAKQSLDIGDKVLERGEVMIFGGDVIYPMATMDEYQDRLITPYRMAFRAAGGERIKSHPGDPADLKKEPHIFALPGSVDWDDDLYNFKKVFCGSFFTRQFAQGWHTRQEQNYFTLKLPDGWWLLGIDINRGSDFDEGQLKYFQTTCNNYMSSGDKAIICVQESYWTTLAKYSAYFGDLGRSIEGVSIIESYLARKGVGVEVYLAGGDHNYRRFENQNRLQMITAGGGGSFLHPTHAQADRFRYKRTDFELKNSYPEPKVSKRLSWRLLTFLMINPKFGILMAAIYAMLAWLLQGAIDPNVSSWTGAFNSTVSGLIAEPLAAFFIIAILAGFVFFTDSESKVWKIIGGMAHGLANLAAVFLITWFVFLSSIGDIYSLKYASNDLNSNLIRFAYFISITALGGFTAGPMIMGIYLFISLNLFSRHQNEAFSALKIEDYKNFLRLHIDGNGELTIYPIKIEKVPRKWNPIYEYYEPVEITPDSVPRLIEDPIVLKPRSREDSISP